MPGAGRVVAGPDGVDEVELLLAPHAGAPPLPIAKGASGGELSRVMLAVEVVLAGADTVPTLVFDEVDAGVGGHAAVEIGRRLARLAETHQVVVVTHLAQVAAYADRQLMVDKGAASEGVTRSSVRTLDDARAGRRARPDARRAPRRPRPAGRTPRSCWPPRRRDDKRRAGHGADPDHEGGHEGLAGAAAAGRGGARAETTRTRGVRADGPLVGPM